MYEDDGLSSTSLDDGAFELLRFEAQRNGDSLGLIFTREGGEFSGRPASRDVTITLHNWTDQVGMVRFAGESIRIRNRMPRNGVAAVYDADEDKLTVRVRWNHEAARLDIDGTTP